MGNTPIPISVLLTNLSDIHLAGISSLLLEVDRSPFQIVPPTSLDSLGQRIRELRPHLLLVGLPRKGVDVNGTIVGRIEETIAEIREQFPEIIIAVFAIPGVEEYREALAITKRAGVEAELSLEMKGMEMVRNLKQLLVERAEDYKKRLRDLPIGKDHWRDYELFAEEVLPFLFKPHFTRFRSQVRRGSGDRPDLVCRNEGQHKFCKIILQKHDARYVVFEVKNQAKPEVGHLREMDAFLTPATTGRFGILLVRQPPKQPQTLYKRLGDLLKEKEKMIVVLCDDDVLKMLDMRIRLSEPMDYLEERYDHYMMHM